ncbi:disease resistance protein At4g27190-like, partial [Fagus crenata]
MNLQPNHGALEKEMKSLMDHREEVEAETRLADDQGHGIRADVKMWLVHVEELLRKNNPILGPPQCSLNCCKWCGANWEVIKIFNEITRLLDAGSFPNGVADPSPRAVLPFP